MTLPVSDEYAKNMAKSWLTEAQLGDQPLDYCLRMVEYRNKVHLLSEQDQREYRRLKLINELKA